MSAESVTTDPAAEAALLLTKQQAASRLSIGVRTLEDWVASGVIGCIRRPRFIRFRPQDLAQFIESHAVQPAGFRNVRRHPGAPETAA